MIAPHILAISAFLSVMWGIYLAYTVQDYRLAKGSHVRPEIVRAFRRMLVVLCLWSICFAYVFRTLCVIVGLGDAWAGQVAFFAILGLNVPSSIFTVISFRFD